MKTFAVVASLAVTAVASPLLHLDTRQSSTTSSNSTTTILPPSQDPWYTGPDEYEYRQPGAVLRLRLAPGNLSSIIGNASAAYNILYRTTDSRYNSSWAVTTLFVPAANISCTNDQLLSYQIPYDSAFVDASPSYALYSGGEDDISAALGQGWYVNVPDYEGPLASFTAGVQSGHATLDSVRAVLNAGLGLNVSATRYAMWGYSGGALASEWAAELQNQYAPELNFSGAALGGLTPNVSSVLEAVTGNPTAGLIPAGILGLASQYPELETFLRENIKQNGTYNATTFFNARNQTLLGTIQTFVNQNITDYFVDGLESLQAPIAQYVINHDGVMGYHGVPDMPVFAYKAIMDEVSPVNDTDVLIERYCGRGANIHYDRNTVGSHGPEAANGRDRAVTFLTAVLTGTYNVTSGCTIQNVTIGS